jgi:hypothetical protein
MFCFLCKQTVGRTRYCLRLYFAVFCVIISMLEHEAALVSGSEGKHQRKQRL